MTSPTTTAPSKAPPKLHVQFTARRWFEPQITARQSTEDGALTPGAVASRDLLRYYNLLAEGMLRPPLQGITRDEQAVIMLACRLWPRIEEMARPPIALEVIKFLQDEDYAWTLCTQEGVRFLTSREIRMLETRMHNVNADPLVAAALTDAVERYWAREFENERTGRVETREQILDATWLRAQ